MTNTPIDQPQDIEVLGIKEADFQSWKHHPVTKAYMQWMTDYAKALREERSLRLDGSMESPDPYLLGEFKGRINTLTEAAGGEFHHIATFYQEPDKDQETNAA